MNANESKEFLLAVINADDRAGREGTRKRFVRKYRSYFPDDMQGEGAENALRVLLRAYSSPHMWWDRTAPEFEKPLTEFALHVAVQRDKLRSIWLASRHSDAVYRLESLRSDVQQYRRGKEGNEPWRLQSLAALEWLQENLSKLCVCENPECHAERHYFIREWSNQKYCCELCTQQAQELRRREQLKARPTKEYKRTAETRRKMAESADRRWRKKRSEDRYAK